MTRSEKAKAILQILDDYFPEVKVPLSHRDPYTLLIAVLLSARCTDERVNKTTPELFALADNPADMMKVPVEKIKQIIKPCGLSPAKSKAIAATSRILVEKYQGKVPEDMAALEALPGVGHKTASVVLCQAFNIPAFPVDTHIHRLAYRWGLSDGSSVEQTEKDLKSLIPRSKWIKAHLQIILFGRKYCPARAHEASKCPVCSRYGVKNRM
ncbi:MAG TPA: endonuclease III [Saprospiraceae bacterium]|nr:endonuclease III [Saprospiraceae bacterium]HNT19308.1 endonuclease III [Saprospiraceae bacterium]